MNHFIAILLLSVASWAGILPPVSALTIETRKKAELKELHSQISDVRKRLFKARSTENDTQRQLREAEIEIGRIATELRKLGKRLRFQTTRLTELQQERSDLLHGLSIQRRALGHQIRTAYIIGRQDYLKILLNQEDPALVGRSLTYHDYLNRARSKQITQLNSQLEQLASVEKAINRETEALRQLQSRNALNRERLETQQQARKTLLSRLGKEIQQENSRLKRLNENKRRLEQLLKELRQVLADIPTNLDQHKTFAQMKRRLPWPYAGKVRHRFGSRRELGNLKWQGMVISAAEGDTVKAVYYGRVAFADWLRGLGLLIILDHGNGFMSLYGHNQSLLKETGDWVEPGEPVATVGNSGGNNQPGGYFEIRHNGLPLNPALWCRR
ncbi:MAG: peptidoglycan DD-metalloendopeptidase family protein [Gammaproteobacteria bacterium]|nr:peptidoglycan DD-metalloendopeptidase family protein [Gammaproteobacteria bacterium]